MWLQPIGHQRHLLHTALSQLHQLKVLHLGVFLTQDVVSVVTGLRLSQLHTFGFCLHRRNAEHFAHQIECMYMECPKAFTLFPYDEDMPAYYSIVLVPVADVTPMSLAFPELQQMEVFFDSLPDSGTISLDCSVLNQANFPKLRGFTCYCTNSWLKLRDLPSTCYGVVKSCKSW